MAVYLLSEDIIFPPVNLADPDGLLAMGGDLSVDRLVMAYRSGIFPWYADGQPILWWSPDPRFVLRPERLQVSHSMRQVLRSGTFRATLDQDFRGVVTHCKTAPRKGQAGTWITGDMLEAYCKLHEAGFAHSVEVWQDAKLVGGLYGLTVGACFCGESMFALVPNASKFALISLAQRLMTLNFKLIDCQVYTKHLQSLGAEKMPRQVFLLALSDALRQKPEKLTAEGAKDLVPSARAMEQLKVS